MKGNTWALALSVKGKLMAAFAVGGLLLGSFGPLLTLKYVYESVQYPGATRVAPGQFKLETLSEGHFSADDTFYTGDDFTRVLDWYLHRFTFAPGATFTSGCLTFTQAVSQVFLQQSLNLTLCDHGKGVWILIERSLGINAPGR